MTTATPDQIAHAAIEACAQFLEMGASVVKPDSTGKVGVVMKMLANDLRKYRESLAAVAVGSPAGSQ